jgi:hypothetical protein
MYDWVLSKRPTDLVGLIKVHGPVIIVTLNPQVELVERCISFRKDVYLTDLSEEVLLSRNRKKCCMLFLRTLLDYPKRCCYHEIGKRSMKRAPFI